MTETNLLDYEQLKSLVRGMLPEPIDEQWQIDGSEVLIGGEPSQVVVRITRRTVSVYEFKVGWDGPHTPVRRDKKLATICWTRLNSSTVYLVLSPLIESTCEARKEGFQKCSICGELKPPEHLLGATDEPVCHGCAQRDMGVVF